MPKGEVFEGELSAGAEKSLKKGEGTRSSIRAFPMRRWVEAQPKI